ncbi:MAG: diaminopimelate epimerase [Pyrinomonadaceae bacterium]
MTPIKFSKFHGFGNDYIVIENGQIPSGADLPDLARAICNRHTGAGSDGIAVIEKLDGEIADYFCEIVNPDGSIAGFSGNGTRCAVAYLYDNGMWQDTHLRLRTRSGVKTFELIEHPKDGSYWFRAEIGKPRFASDEIPIAVEPRADSVIDHPISIEGGRDLLISGINTGNPVACTFVDDFEFDWRSLGKALEVHEAFPEKANIVFVKPITRDHIELRIWERAAGETSSSGTCCSAAAVLCAFTGRTGRTVFVHTEGGVTGIDWREDGEILITGRADLSYFGSWPI